MNYYHTVLKFAKKPLHVEPCTIRDGDPIPHRNIDMDQVIVELDPNYMVGLPDEVHRQIDRIRKLGLTPRYVTMNIKTYEKTMVYNHNLNGMYDIPKKLFGLEAVVTPSFNDYQVEVQCDPESEFLYRDELSKARYEMESERD
jgi:hypothetical protein